MIILSFIFINVYATEINRGVSQRDIDIYEKKMEDYPDASVAILLDDTFTDLEKDFSYTFKRRLVKKILNYKGKKEHAEFKIIYDKRYETVEIDKAQTIKMENGQYKIINIDKEVIREIDAPFDSGNMHYAVHKMIIAAFSSVEEGDIIDITYTIKNTQKNKFNRKIVYAADEPIYEKNFTLSYFHDQSPVINYKNCENKLNIEKSKFGEKIRIKWSAKSLEQVLAESSTPRSEYFLPTVFVSFYKDWKEYKNLIYKKINDKIKVTKSIEKIVNGKDIKNLEMKDKIIYLKNYVAKNIEVKTVNDVLNFPVREVDKILESGYAASMDRAVLLCALLKGIDIKAYPVLIGNDKLYWEKLKDNLQVDDFNYMLIEFELDNQKYYLETESEFYKFGEINCINEMGLVINNQDDFIIEIDPEENFYEKYVTKKKVNLSKLGEAKIETKTLFYGIAAQQVRKKYKYMAPIKRKQDFEALISSISYSAKAVSKELEISYDSPVSIAYQYSDKNFAIVDKEYYYFKLETQEVDYDLTEEIQNRKYPYVSLADNVEIQEIELVIPKSYKIELLPENLNIDNKYITLKKSFEKEGNKVIVKTYIKYKPFLIAKEEYSNFYNIIIDLFHPRHKLFLLKKID
jgi:hypothetical protein